MDDEKTIPGLTELSVRDVMQMHPDHDPSPVIELVPNPNGDGSLGLVKKRENEWGVELFAGPRGLACRHTFVDLNTFASWLKRSSADPNLAQIFVDIAFPISAGERQAKREIRARLDPRDPNGDVVVCEIQLSPEFSAWVADTHGMTMDQRGLFRLLRGHGACLARIEQRESLLASLAALRIVSNGELQTELAANGRTIVSGMRQDVQVSQELPAEIDLLIPIFEGVCRPVGPERDSELARYEIRAMLEVETSGGGLRVQISYPDVVLALRRATEDLVAHLQRDLGEEWLVCQGSEKAESVPLLSDGTVGVFAAE